MRQKVSVDSGVIEARAISAKTDFKELAGIFHQNDNVITSLCTAGPQEVSYLIGTFFKLPECHGLATANHLEGNFFGRGLGEESWVVHRTSLFQMFSMRPRSALSMVNHNLAHLLAALEIVECGLEVLKCERAINNRLDVFEFDCPQHGLKAAAMAHGDAL